MLETTVSAVLWVQTAAPGAVVLEARSAWAKAPAMRNAALFQIRLIADW